MYIDKFLFCGEVPLCCCRPAEVSLGKMFQYLNLWQITLLFKVNLCTSFNTSFLWLSEVANVSFLANVIYPLVPIYATHTFFPPKMLACYICSTVIIYLTLVNLFVTDAIYLPIVFFPL